MQDEALVHLSAEEIDSEIENPKSAISYDHDPGYDLQRYLAWPRRACKRSNSKIMRIPSRKTAKKSRTRQPSSTIRQALSQAALEVCVCDFLNPLTAQAVRDMEYADSSIFHRPKAISLRNRTTKGIRGSHKAEMNEEGRASEAGHQLAPSTLTNEYGKKTESDDD